ncbi:MAG: TauD/TfdA family dioxygenase [Rhodospirillaceae bacterium]|jgi:taurine dioxygenase|nr:TauD/TfdA family dioxygenase [Rhodospirillaceae bacterium]MBT5459234.1 TauD/TfdA family dioxygenase [Rhodospirillaceae bacterium]
MQVNRLSEALGVEISGIDITDLDDATFAEIRDVFHDSHVIVFRDQHVSVEDHIAFSHRFGDLEIHIATDHLLKDHPEILLVTNKKENGKYIGVENAGDEWHSDLSYMDKPSLGSLLYALEVSQDGGDTEWSNMYTAYETLPEETKQRIQDLKARHSFNRFRNPRIGIPEQHRENAEERYAKISPPDVIHPVVRTHPVTNRKALYVSPRFTIGIEDLPEQEGQALLDELFEHATRREFIYRHEWRLGDLLFWDNRCTLHLACRGIPEGQIRHMHRTTISGDVPV